ncbi:ParB/RepB/Spo0J family partition protein [Leuconostoc palmae]|uniref:ParB/RepB/Spo0J family partition protein n=1 Tax=Leuconostoc palmae TaxID=501487 RepID=UPI001C7D0464|nr:ParB/RepB/Spo0J family partition protein [Leuconostoc palmae]
MVSKKGGLGKGLGGLFNANSVTEEALEHTKNVIKTPASFESVTKISLADIAANPFQPRHHFDNDKLKELANSIIENGILTPIIVRKHDKGYQIVAGERRVRASKLAKQSTITAIIREVDDNTMAAVALVENLQRDELDAIEEATAYEALMSQLGLTQVELAKKVGKERTTVANAIRLLKLPETVQNMVRNGNLSMGQARAILGLKDKKRIESVAHTVIKRQLSVRQVESLVKQLNIGSIESHHQVNQQISPYVRALSTQLEEKFGTKVKVNTSDKGTGKIEINYVSNEDLERILNILEIEVD